MPSITLVSPRGGSVVVSELGDLEHYLRRNWAPQSGSAEEARASFTGMAARPVALEQDPLPGPAVAFAGVIATLRRGFRSTCVGVVSDSTGDGYEAGATSVRVDEWPQALIKRLGADFPAYTVLERRWNDGAQGYDPATVYQNGKGNGGGDRRATFSKTTPGSLSYAGQAITGDIEIRARIAPTGWAASGGGTIAAKWEGGTGQRSWVLLLNADGTLGFQWTTDGVTNPGAKPSTATVQSAGAVNGQPYWVRVQLDVDNGASGNTLTFSTSPDGANWTQLGTPVVTAGVTSIFGGTAPYQLGSFTSGFSTPFGGDIYEIYIRPGLSTRRSVVPPIVDEWDIASGLTTVTYGGAPVLTLLNGASSGKDLVYFDEPTRRQVIHQPFGQAVIVVNTSHNDLPTGQTWLANYSTLVDNIRTLVPYTPVLALGQNPVGAGGPLALSQIGVELRATRSARLGQLAASKAGMYFFDTWPLLTTADTLDLLHPGPAGSQKQSDGLYRAIVRI